MVNNRGSIGGVAALWAGYATDDPELINAGLYGIQPLIKKSDAPRRKHFPPPKDWVAATEDHPANGLLTIAFSTKGIPAGMWVEPSPSYAFYVLGSLIDAAEISWHHGLDLYRVNGAILKYMFDAPLLLAFPDLTLPGQADAQRRFVVDEYNPSMYEYGWRRYRDPRYLSIIRAGMGLDMTRSPGVALPPLNIRTRSRHLDLTNIGSAPPSLLFDLDETLEAPKPDFPNANFPEVGYGILRVGSPSNSLANLMLTYGPSASHGHPDKLHIDLYADDDVLLPSPGIDFPYYNNPRIEAWYHTTIAHNTLAVDQQTQPFIVKLLEAEADVAS